MKNDELKTEIAEAIREEANELKGIRSSLTSHMADSVSLIAESFERLADKIEGKKEKPKKSE
jgi:hypothetical protein